MANEFIARKGLIALEDSQITGSLNISSTLKLPGFSDVSASLAAAVAGGDNLGNHTALEDLNMGGNDITNVGNVDGVDVSTLNTSVSTNTTNITTLTAATSSYLTSVPGGTLSGSAQIATEISGAFTAASASFSTRVTANDAKVSYTDAAVTNVINTAGVISSSAQLDFVDTTGTPANNQLAVFTDADTIEGAQFLNFTNQGGLVINNAASGVVDTGLKVHGNIFGSGSLIRLKTPKPSGGDAGFYFSASGDLAVGSFKIFTGDIEGVGNSTLLTVDDANEQITTSKTLGVTGNITVTGTVDGRDIAADGTKLDGITAAGISGSFTAASASFSTRVTANDAKVSYTDAAVTSVINTAGVISGSAQFGSSDNVTFGTIEATSLNVTSITSSIVTSSIVQTEGSNIFGDTSADTHTFNGNITASGNISASSMIATSFNGTLLGAALTAGTANTTNAVNFTNASNDVEYGLLFRQGNGTSAQTVFADSQAATPAWNPSKNILTVGGPLIATNITASGTISASGQIIGSNLSGTNTGDQDLSSYIQASQTSSFSTATGVEDNADVTDTANVTSAGALMDSELAEIATVKSLTAAGISGSFNAASASFSTRVTANDAKTGYTDAAVKTKLDAENVISGSAANVRSLLNVEDGADVTDTANVTSAGALMDSELAEIATVKALTKAGISGSFTAASSSFSTRVTANEIITAKTLVSSSAQIASDVSGSFTAVSASFSTRVTANDAKVSYTDAAVTSVINAAGVLSSSEQISADISGAFTATSAALAADIASAGDITGVTAGSGLSGGGSSGAVTVNVDYGSGTIITDAGAFNTGGTSAANDLLLVHHNDDGEAQKVGITAFMDEYKIVNRTGTPVDNDYAKFTDANTIEGRSFSEVKTDLSLGNVTNESKATMFTSPTFTGNVTASGNISASGAISASAFVGDGSGLTGVGTVDTTGTPADDQIAVFTDANTIEGTTKLTFSNSELLVHSTNTDNTGIEIFGGIFGVSQPYISPVGANSRMNFGDGTSGHIFDFGNNKIGFDSDSTNTFIQADTDDPENLEIHADNNIELNADNLVTMGTASIEHRLFDTGSTHLNANSAIGDIVKFGGSTTVAGGVYYLKSDGTWGLAQANAVGTATSSLAVAVGTNSTTDGMCLRGFVNPFTDPDAGTGNPVYLSDTSQGRFQATAPDSNNDVVRILGYQYGTDLIYFNPSNDFIVITA